MTEDSAQTVGAWLQIGEYNHVALATPGRPLLSYAGLRRQTSITAVALSALGMKHNDRIAEWTGDGKHISLFCNNDVVASKSGLSLIGV